MAELTISQLIKIIIGALVVVVVVVGLSIFFKDYIIDFFKNILGEESEEDKINVDQEEQGFEDDNSGLGTPSRLCEDCGKGFRPCTHKKCFEISRELMDFGKQCRFEESKLDYVDNLFNLPPSGKCTTIDL